MVKQLLACVTIVAGAASYPPAAAADPLAHTFSIVARDAIRALAPSGTPRRR